MINFNCVLQEGVIPHELRSTLAAELVRISVSVFGEAPDDVEVAFSEIPHGYAFRGGKVSTTSSVRGTINPGCEQSVRVEFMQQICDMWMRVTGCSTDELVVSARDRR